MAFKTLPLLFLGFSLLFAAAFVYLARYAHKGKGKPNNLNLLITGAGFTIFILLWLVSR